MSDGNWNPWKMTAIGMGLVIATALVTGIVVGGLPGRSEDRISSDVGSMRVEPPRTAAARPNTLQPSTAVPTAAPVPSRATIAACNEQAATTKDKTLEVVKDSAVAGLLGAAVGAAGGAIADGGKGAGKGAGIGGVVGLGVGALYGLNENRKNDDRYRHAYAACMHARGYGE